MSPSYESSPWAGRLQVLASSVGFIAAAFVMLVILHEMYPDALHREPAPAQPHTVSEWPALRAVGHRIGKASAPIEIVEFTDFQCPACAQMATRLARLDEEYPGRLSVIVRHYPLAAIHPLAMGAAIAAECAATATTFVSFYRVAFDQQDSLGLRSFAALASLSGVRDTVAFNRCLESAQPRGAVARDLAAGKALAIHSTPTLIINGTLYPQSPSDSELEHMVALTAVK